MPDNLVLNVLSFFSENGVSHAGRPADLTVQLSSDGVPVIVISDTSGRAMKAVVEDDKFARITDWPPLRRRFGRILTLQQEVTLLAALRFYQAHGGPLDQGVQQFMDEQSETSLTSEQIDDMYRVIFNGAKVAVQTWAGSQGVAPAMYVQVVVGGTDPLLIGPFDTDDARDEAAEIAYAKHGPESTILWLDDDNGALTTGAYATDYFHEEADDAGL